MIKYYEDKYFQIFKTWHTNMIKYQEDTNIEGVRITTDLSSDWQRLARLLFGVDTCFWLYISDKSTWIRYLVGTLALCWIEF